MFEHPAGGVGIDFQNEFSLYTSAQAQRRTVQAQVLGVFIQPTGDVVQLHYRTGTEKPPAGLPIFVLPRSKAALLELAKAIEHAANTLPGGYP